METEKIADRAAVILAGMAAREPALVEYEHSQRAAVRAAISLKRLTETMTSSDDL